MFARITAFALLLGVLSCASRQGSAAPKASGADSARAVSVDSSRVRTVAHYGVKVVASYPHDRSAYTQGLFFSDGTLYESTGQCGASRVRKVDLVSGRSIAESALKRKYFGEGSVIFDGKLYLLTWQNRVAFAYDPETLQLLKTFAYPREGWGLTTDGRCLIASDGSDRLYFMDKSLKVLRTLRVTLNGKRLSLLNELEWIDGRIWANVYTTDRIVIINPADGVVEGVVDCKGLLPDSLRDGDTDVLNGIAANPADGRIYLTGKCWPRLYEINLISK